MQVYGEVVNAHAHAHATVQVYGEVGEALDKSDRVAGKCKCKCRCTCTCKVDEALDKSDWVAAATGVVIMYCPIERAVERYFPRMKKMHKLREMSLCNNDITALAHVNGLSCLSQLVSLEIKPEGILP